jgi:peptide subunit release factor 1 (eRF1)
MLAPTRGLRSLFDGPGPYASIYVTSDARIENAGIVTQQRWAPLRDRLQTAGATDDILSAVDELVPTAHRSGACLAVIATPGSNLHVEFGDETPPRDIASWDSLPMVAPLVKWRQSKPSFVVVLADRRGADVTAVSADRGKTSESIDGVAEEPLTKVAPGGWSQRRYQRRAENTWERHARDIAQVVRRAVEDVRAELVVVAGDVRAVQLLEEHLPPAITPLLEHVPGGRAHDGSDEETAAWIKRWVATAEARTTVSALEKFREELGQQDRAVEGPAETLRALSAGQVELLLVHDDWANRRRAFFTRDSQPVSVARNDPALDAGVAEDGRLADVAIRGALATDADVRIVPAHGGPRGGVGGLLRWA